VRGWFWELLTFVLVSGFLILVDWWHGEHFSTFPWL
jgi:hypothetical protein